MSHDITTTRESVAEALTDWQKVRHVISGERAIKAADRASAATYLPKPNPSDTSDANDERYDQYIERAVFYNASARTLNGLVGIAFRRKPEVELPGALDVLLDDTDGAGGGLYNQAHRSLEDTLCCARAGLLVDYPQTGGATSYHEQQEQELHPIVSHYAPESIINWRVNKKKKLTLVVLYEPYEAPDGYGVKTVERWRELTLEDEAHEGVYLQRIWEAPEGQSEPVVIEELVPKDSAGKPWREIPFTFIGAIDNDPDIDKAPLLDLVNLNVAHYRSSANYFESEYFCGQPTFTASGIDEVYQEQVWKDGNFYVGCRAIIPLPEGGQFQIAQAQPNTLSAEAMQKLEAQMIALGARLLTPGEAVKTAEQSRSETAAAHSVLSLACDNVSSAYTMALQWAARFGGDNEDEASFAFHTDFTGLIADPNLINALVKGWQAGSLPDSDLWAAFRQLGIVDPEKTDEEIQEELDEAGGGLDLDGMSQFEAQQQGAPAEPGPEGDAGAIG